MFGQVPSLGGDGGLFFEALFFEEAGVVAVAAMSSSLVPGVFELRSNGPHLRIEARSTALGQVVGHPALGGLFAALNLQFSTGEENRRGPWLRVRLPPVKPARTGSGAGLVAAT